MTSPTVQRRRRRRVLALATAGLALCIGVSVTSLAAWQQNISVSGGANSIGSSLLKIELSLDGGTTWTTATVNSNGNLGFSGSPTLLTPGDTVYASVLLRAAAGSRAATVTLSGGAVTGTLVNALTDTARSGVPLLSCNSTSFAGVGTTLVGLGTALTSGSGTTGFSLDAERRGRAGRRLPRDLAAVRGRDDPRRPLDLAGVAVQCDVELTRPTRSVRSAASPTPRCCSAPSPAS